MVGPNEISEVADDVLCYEMDSYIEVGFDEEAWDDDDEY